MVEDGEGLEVDLKTCAVFSSTTHNHIMDCQEEIHKSDKFWYYQKKNYFIWYIFQKISILVGIVSWLE